MDKENDISYSTQCAKSVEIVYEIGLLLILSNFNLFLYVLIETERCWVHTYVRRTEYVCMYPSDREMHALVISAFSEPDGS